jgi:hypothetical protein
MKTNNRIDQAFGPIGSTAGAVIFVAGIGIIYFSLAGLLFIIAGAFVGFTTSLTVVDFDNKRIRYGDSYFGFIKTGKWIRIEDSMCLGIKQKRGIWRAYSRSNRMLDIKENNYYIILFDSKHTEIAPILKSTSRGKAEQELENLSSLLGLKTI